jgi:hypothetical protein
MAETTTEHKKSDFGWARTFYAAAQKTFLSVYRAHGTEIAIEQVEFPHHSENSEWKGVEVFVYNQTTFHSFHDARAKELADAETCTIS